jgi:hypothetical protein
MSLYKSDISNALWLALDLPGNAGWIVYLVFLVRCLVYGVGAFWIALIIPAIPMLVGVGELISERISHLDWVLPKKRLWRGFGALTLGGILAVIVAGIGYFLFTEAPVHNWLLWIAISGILLAAISGYLLSRYKKYTKPCESNS